MTAFEDLIERLKEIDIEQYDNNGEMIGEFAVVQKAYSEYCKYKCSYDYWYLFGLVNGLRAIGFVTKEEREQLITFLTGYTE